MRQLWWMPLTDERESAKLTKPMSEEQGYKGSDFYCEEVLSRNTRVDRVLETDDVLAFRHTRPSYETHVVVIPKRHITSLLDPTLAPIEIVRLMNVVQTVASQVLASKGACRVLTNLGKYQDSKHLHWHVISGDALR